MTYLSTKRLELFVLAVLGVIPVDGLSQPAPPFIDGGRVAAPLRFDGPIPVHDGAEPRARALQNMLANATSFRFI
jgi:hypothetical protein